jgi:hypothetical protein
LLAGGFGIGYFIPTKNQPVLSKEIFKTYQWGHALQTVWPKLNEKEKKHLELLIKK